MYDYVNANGVLTADGTEVYSADEVGQFLYHDGGSTQATAIVIQVGSFTDGAVIRPVWAALDEAGAGIASTTTGLDIVATSGDVIAQFVSLEAFANSMRISLPVAILLTLLVATMLLRSFRYALASVVPIGFVVTGVYAFMAVAGYTINVVTATIAAIAVGVGIDFSTHLTARYREELEKAPTPLDALRIAGAGTGGALVLSALTSVLGFTVMSFAPTPIFATFGVLTAVHDHLGAHLGAGRAPQRATAGDPTPPAAGPRAPGREGMGYWLAERVLLPVSRYRLTANPSAYRHRGVRSCWWPEAGGSGCKTD